MSNAPSVNGWRRTVASVGENATARISTCPHDVHDLIEILGLTAWKPILAALALPPVPLLLLALLGARLMFWRRGVAWLVLLLSAALLWLSHTTAVGDFLEQQLLGPYRQPIAADQIADLKRAAPATRRVAIVVLGAGREPVAPEYGLSNLRPQALARLHYGLWLARQTGAPVMFSGGTGHGEPIGPSEAETAARIADKDYGRPLKWVEGESRDTRENAAQAVAMLQAAGVTDLVLVTHGWHMPRAMRAFRAQIERQNAPMRLISAPMGLARAGGNSLRWLPTHEGYAKVRQVLREQLGLLAGA